ncbi:hypothetical protein ABZ917_37460 [Nonomuraea wenchangensis]
MEEHKALHIASSKTDAERLLVIIPELADVLSTIISVPLVVSYDVHESVWNPGTVRTTDTPPRWSAITCRWRWSSVSTAGFSGSVRGDDHDEGGPVRDPDADDED